MTEKRMEWFKQMRALDIILETTPLDVAEHVLLNVLYIKANALGWKTYISISNGVLQSRCGITEKTLIKARNNLVEKGFIKYKKGTKNSAGLYYLEKIYDENITESLVICECFFDLIHKNTDHNIEIAINNDE